MYICVCMCLVWMLPQTRVSVCTQARIQGVERALPPPPPPPARKKEREGERRKRKERGEKGKERRVKGKEKEEKGRRSGGGERAWPPSCYPPPSIKK